MLGSGNFHKTKTEQINWNMQPKNNPYAIIHN